MPLETFLHKSRIKLSRFGIRLNQPVPAVDEPSSVTSVGRTIQRRKRAICRNGKYELLLASGETFLLYPGVDASGVDFTGADLTLVKLNRSTFVGCNFSHCILDSTDFSECTLDGAIFDHAVISNVIFKDSRLIGTSFLGVSGTGARFDTADVSFSVFGQGLSNANFEGAIATAAEFRSVDLTTSFFYLAQLIGAVFSKATLTDALFSSADLSGATFENCTLERTIFEETTLIGTTFIDCDSKHEQISLSFLKADLENARFIRNNFPNMDARRANFTGAHLDMSQFFESNFYGAQFCNATALSCGFNDSTFKLANFEGASFVLSRFRDIRAVLTRFTNASFSNCFFQGAELSRARMTEPTFLDCQFSIETEWPEDYLLPLDPKLTPISITDIGDLGKEFS